MTEQSKTLTELSETIARRVKVEMRTGTVGRVVSFNAATRRVDVLVDILAVVEDVDGNGVTQEPIRLTGVPVHYPGSSQAGATWTLVPGDKVWLKVSDRSLEDWLAKAGAAGAPRARWTHALSDAIAEPMDIFGGPVDPTAFVLDSATLIKLGAGAVSQAVKGTELHTALTAYTTAVASAGAAHAGVVPPTAISNAAFIVALTTATATLASALAGILSAKVQVE